MRYNTNMKKTKIKTTVAVLKLNAMPFRTKAQKCNHWATGELLELGRKCNVTYMHMKCKFY